MQMLLHGAAALSVDQLAGLKASFMPNRQAVIKQVVATNYNDLALCHGFPAAIPSDTAKTDQRSGRTGPFGSSEDPVLAAAFPAAYLPFASTVAFKCTTAPGSKFPVAMQLRPASIPLRAPIPHHEAFAYLNENFCVDDEHERLFIPYIGGSDGVAGAADDDAALQTEVESKVRVCPSSILRRCTLSRSLVSRSRCHPAPFRSLSPLGSPDATTVLHRSP